MPLAGGVVGGVVGATVAMSLSEDVVVVTRTGVSSWCDPPPSLDCSLSRCENAASAPAPAIKARPSGFLPALAVFLAPLPEATAGRTPPIAFIAFLGPDCCGCERRR